MTSGFQRCTVDHFVFIRRHTTSSVVLTVYVDILMTSSNTTGIIDTKKYLRKYFVTKDIDKPRHFLGIEFAYGKEKMVLS